MNVQSSEVDLSNLSASKRREAELNIERHKSMKGDCHRLVTGSELAQPEQG